MEKSDKIIVAGLVAVLGLGTFVADKLGLRLFSNPEKERISARVNRIKEHDFGGIYGGVMDGLNVCYKEKGEYPASLDKILPYVGKGRLDDPFGIELVDNVLPDGSVRELQMKRLQWQYERISLNECRVWSYGPDGDNDRGLKEYNQKKGIKSDGDITLHLKDGKVVFPTPPMSEALLDSRVKRARSYLRNIQNSIEIYKEKYGKNPDSLTDPRLEDLLLYKNPIDPFSVVDQPLGYDQKTGTVYSIGPDGIKGNGAYNPETRNGDISPSTILPGDKETSYKSTLVDKVAWMGRYFRKS